MCVCFWGGIADQGVPGCWVTSLCMCRRRIAWKLYLLCTLHRVSSMTTSSSGIMSGSSQSVRVFAPSFYQGKTFRWKSSRLWVNPFRAAAPFWRQTSQILGSLSQKRDCGPNKQGQTIPLFVRRESCQKIILSIPRVCVPQQQCSNVNIGDHSK